jgi:hypothetical protein
MGIHRQEYKHEKDEEKKEQPSFGHEECIACLRI